MKTKILILFALLINLKFASGQILIESVETAEPIKVSSYDSAFNFPTEKNQSFQQLVGQDIMVLPTKKNSYKGYKDFYMKPREGAKAYKPADFDEYSSDYNELKGKVFEIIDLEKEKNATNPNAYFKLKRKDNSDIVYLKCDFTFLNLYKSLIVLGYYIKQENKILNKRYTIAESFFEQDNLIKHKAIEHTDDVWTCVDIVYDDLLFSFVAKFRNMHGELVACKYNFDSYSGLDYKIKETMSK